MTTVNSLIKVGLIEGKRGRRGYQLRIPAELEDLIG
jgi:hypothetical protein